MGSVDRGGHLVRHARHAHDPGVRVLLDVRLAADRRPDVGARRPAGPRLPARRHRRPHHADRRGAAAQRRALAAARVRVRGVRVLRPGVGLRDRGDHQGRAAADVRLDAGAPGRRGHLLLPHRLQRAVPAAAGARRSTASTRASCAACTATRAVDAAGTADDAAGAGARLGRRDAVGAVRAAAARGGLGRRRGRLVGHLVDRAAAGRARLRVAQPAAPGRGDARAVRDDRACRRARAGGRGLRLDARGARPDLPLGARRRRTRRSAPTGSASPTRGRPPAGSSTWTRSRSCSRCSRSSPGPARWTRRCRPRRSPSTSWTCRCRRRSARTGAVARRSPRRCAGRAPGGGIRRVPAWHAGDVDGDRAGSGGTAAAVRGRRAARRAVAPRGCTRRR